MICTNAACCPKKFQFTGKCFVCTCPCDTQLPCGHMMHAQCQADMRSQGLYRCFCKTWNGTQLTTVPLVESKKLGSNTMTSEEARKFLACYGCDTLTPFVVDYQSANGGAVLPISICRDCYTAEGLTTTLHIKDTVPRLIKYWSRTLPCATSTVLFDELTLSDDQRRIVDFARTNASVPNVYLIVCKALQAQDVVTFLSMLTVVDDEIKFSDKPIDVDELVASGGLTRKNTPPGTINVETLVGDEVERELSPSDDEAPMTAASGGVRRQRSNPPQSPRPSQRSRQRLSIDNDGPCGGAGGAGANNPPPPSGEIIELD